jgi:hypothetical protein
VKIKGTCTRCERDFMTEQVVAGGGSCPWCGSPAQPDYAATLVDALRDAEEAGSRLQRALEAVADLDPALRLDEGSVTGPLKASLARIGRNLVRQG